MTMREYIIQKMSELYTMFCFPRVMTKISGEFLSIEYVWRSEKAEKTYNELQKILATL